jgi:multidrug resistance protein MdtO
MMWLVFDHLWAVPAAVEMKSALISAIRLLAQLTREPSSSDPQTALKRSYLFGSTLNARMDQVRSAADAVLFEFGPSRPQALALRDRIRRWQPQLRTLFLMRRASLRYALRLPGFELPEAGQIALREYNDCSARMLENMAARLESGEAHITPETTPEPEDTGQLLERFEGGCGAHEPRELPAHIPPFMLLLRKIDGVTRSLAEEIAGA